MKPYALLLLTGLLACKMESSDDRKRHVEELKAAIGEQREPYMKTIEAFLDATSKKDFDRAYGLLAPSYTNMVTREQFVAAIASNKNFEHPVTLDVFKTVNNSGTFTITCGFGELGRAEISLIDTPAGPRLSAIVLGGAAALPMPMPPSTHP